LSKIEVNAVEPQCGTTLTLGGSGDTVTLGSGASQSGFGRTGTVDWQTGSIKTATFTAANGEGYFANTSGGAFSMNLPAGTAGNIVSVVDYTNTFQTNNLTIVPNGSQKIGGVAASRVLNTEGQSVTFVYVDDTEGWKNVQDSTSNIIGNAFIAASGGTESTCGDYKIHKFTGPGTFTVSKISCTAAENIVSYLVVAGGGAGGSNRAGGGGGGGFREYKGPADCYTASPLNGNPGGTAITVTAQAYPITVGAGATGNNCGTTGTNGNPSVFSTVTSTAGGGGGARTNGAAGGSGGGAACTDGSSSATGGAGNTPPVSPSQGFPGGNAGGGCSGPYRGAGSGGGGATEAGVGNPTSVVAGRGGAGATTSISGTPTSYSGGGGGGAYANTPPSGPGTGTVGAASPCGTGTAGASGGASSSAAANTGGGSGAGGINFSPPSVIGKAGNGGSGIVIIRYKFQ
jgi:hypothetical protein